MSGDDHTKTTVTISTETEEYLHDTYPDALSTQEALRMAVSDARLLRSQGTVYLPPEAWEDA